MLFKPFFPLFSQHFAFPSNLLLHSSLSFSHPPLSSTLRHTMSSEPPPSAFDKLLSGARASKKKLPPPSSSKKRKAPTPPPSSSPHKTLETVINPNNNLKTVQNPEETVHEDPSSKIRNTSSSSNGIVAELKEKVPELKKKPENFDPSSVVCWEKNKPVPFLFLSLAFDLISKERGRIVITEIVCNLLRTVIHATPDDLVPVVYLSANKIAPAYKGLELGIGDASIIRALADACGRTEKHIKSQYKKKGDLGLVAQASRSSQTTMRKHDALTIRKVFDTFHLIAKESGKDSQEKKKNHIKSLLFAATDCEPLYIIRLLQTKLRIGYAEQTLLAALGQAAVHTEEHSNPPPGIKSPLEEAAKIVKKVYSVLPDYDKIVSALLKDGVWELPKKCDFTPGVPVGPMLSKATKSVSEILNKFQGVEFTCEYKYDGERAQIHFLENGSVEIYSRNAERNTGKYPDVIAAVSRLKKTTVSSFILDCELVAYDHGKQTILPFQVLSTRSRKNVAKSDIKVAVCVFAFDLLHLNGHKLFQENLKIRREHLYTSFEEESGFLQFATSTTSNDVEEIQEFFDKAIEASLGDSLDLVPIGAFHGRGKRTGVYGAFLVACYDNERNEFQSIVRLATGFKEQELKERSTILRSKVIPKPKAYYSCGESINPDVWLEASEVWEVKAADLTISPVYRAAEGKVDSVKGISLRFPRFIRVRPDKTPEQSSSSEQIAEMYNAQKLNHTGQQDDDEDD
ncbi:DNA ligase 1 isoform X2 [Medicago truncatula]|uniref:DNA ligase 1 isoform X2 n=1 Tax=Medicago truncatula TaxID=3880 RepID=UPI0019687D24|nr:DNA ligase 1 isoform X2 [Medicago truncatula]